MVPEKNQNQQHILLSQSIMSSVTPTTPSSSCESNNMTPSEQVHRHHFPLLDLLTRKDQHHHSDDNVHPEVTSNQIQKTTNESEARKTKLKKLKTALLDILHEDHAAENPDAVPTQYATPGQLIELVAKGGVHKAHMTVDQLLLMGFMGGCYVGLGGLLAYSVTGDSPFLVSNPGLSRFTFGILFPVALVIIILTGSELYTGNSFTLVPALLNRQINIVGFIKNWVCVYLSNCIGALFTAYFFGYWAMKLAIPKPTTSTESHTLEDNGLMSTAFTLSTNGTISARMPVWAHVLIHSVEVKAAKPMYLQFLQGIGANWCVCLAVFLAYAARDAISKVFVSVLPVSIFVSLGWEHCIANSFLIPLGMMYGADVTVGKFFINLVFVTLGNTLAGVVLIGLPFWYVYHFRQMHHDALDRMVHKVTPCIFPKHKDTKRQEGHSMASDIHDCQDSRHGTESIHIDAGHCVIELDTIPPSKETMILNQE